MHHQSPIDVERSRAVVDHPNYLQCTDGHKMTYFDSSCSFDELREKNAFVIERNALKIIQPINVRNTSSGLHDIDCENQPINGRNIVQWGRLDFPEGFGDWWLLSHMEFHVPSEHTQEGKRYSGEIQLYHFYEVTGVEAGINNEVSPKSHFFIMLILFDENELLFLTNIFFL
jgi:hypothetical protein